jgi:hypothetical protein
VKLSNEIEKATVPGRKQVLRLAKDGEQIADLLILDGEVIDVKAGPVRVYLISGGRGEVDLVADEVEELLLPLWGPNAPPEQTVGEIRESVIATLAAFTKKVLCVDEGAERYKLALSCKLYGLMLTLQKQETGGGEV